MLYFAVNAANIFVFLYLDFFTNTPKGILYRCYPSEKRHNSFHLKKHFSQLSNQEEDNNIKREYFLLSMESFSLFFFFKRDKLARKFLNILAYLYFLNSFKFSFKKQFNQFLRYLKKYKQFLLI